MDKHTKQTVKDQSGYVSFEHTYETWPGCGFKSKTVTVKVRRVIHDDRNEAQLSIEVRTLTERQGRTQYSELTLTPGEAINFALALLAGTEFVNLINGHINKMLTE